MHLQEGGNRVPAVAGGRLLLWTGGTQLIDCMEDVAHSGGGGGGGLHLQAATVHVCCCALTHCMPSCYCPFHQQQQRRR
jgi:hypothetical protein